MCQSAGVGGRLTVALSSNSAAQKSFCCPAERQRRSDKRGMARGDGRGRTKRNHVRMFFDLRREKSSLEEQTSVNEKPGRSLESHDEGHKRWKGVVDGELQAGTDNRSGCPGDTNLSVQPTPPPPPLLCPIKVFSAQTGPISGPE